MKFNQKLQKLRKENHLSQEALADALEVSRQAVSKWESGQTYPEMDKLISMCKIFKCTLDDLTNDDVEIGDTFKQKKNAQNIVDELLEMIGKTYTMFRSMSFKEVFKCLFELFILIIILSFFSIPVEGIYHLASEIFMNFGSTIGSTLSSIFHFIIMVAYAIVAVVIFVYIYKIRFLDHFEIIEKEIGEKGKDPKEISVVTKTETVVVKERKRDEVPSPILHTLGNIFVFLLKAFVLLWGIPCILFLLFLCICLVLTIILGLKGVFFVGIFLGILAFLTLTVLAIEWIFRFICNQKIPFKRLLITCIGSVAIIGISIGITMYDFTKITYIDEVPQNIKQVHIEKEFDKNTVQFVDIDSFDHQLEYVTDESLGDKIRIDIMYYEKYAKYELDTYPNGAVWIHRNDIYMNEYSKLLAIFTENLGEQKIYNYTKLYDAEIRIIASSATIEQLNARFMEEQRKREEEERNSYGQVYEEQLQESHNQLSKKQEEISRLEQENASLNQKIEEYKQRITQYKEHINDL